jgi:hypothetical protein
MFKMNNRREGYVTGQVFFRTAEGEEASFVKPVNWEYKNATAEWPKLFGAQSMFSTVVIFNAEPEFCPRLLRAKCHPAQQPCNMIRIATRMVQVFTLIHRKPSET